MVATLQVLVWAIPGCRIERRSHAEQVGQWRFVLVLAVAGMLIDRMGGERVCREYTGRPHDRQCSRGPKQRSPRHMAAERRILACEPAHALLEKVAPRETDASVSRRHPR